MTDTTTTPPVKPSDIPVVILCGGKGTRLKEETEIIPKPLVKIGDRPILWHIMKIYSAHGFNRFILPTGYKGEKIKEYFFNYAAMQGDCTVDFSNGERKVAFYSPIREPWKITIADTGLETEAGARIKKIEPYLRGERFLLTYGDGVSNVAIPETIRFHAEQGKTATVTAVHPPARFGDISVEGNLAVGFHEKPQLSTGHINGGFFVFEPSIFSYLADPTVNLERDVLPKLVNARELAVYRHDGYWQCMDTIRDVEFLNNEWAKGEAPWKVWRD